MNGDVEAYRHQIEQWRKQREEALRAPDGWLGLAGLFILQDGEYSVGSDENNEIILPASAPARVGTLTFQDGSARLTVTTTTPIMVDGSAVTSVELVDNRNGQRPTLVTAGSVTFNLHKFGNDFAIRVRDRANPAISEFAGCVWYEINPGYRVVGTLNRDHAATALPVSTSVKTMAEYQSIGTVEFVLDDQPLQLLASASSKPNELFFIFRDATAGRTTYGAGRYLYAEVDAAGTAVLDFNKAYNPPCVFTPYATCSLPPRANMLPVAIEAGERYSSF